MACRSDSGLSADYLNATSVLRQPLLCWFAFHGCTGACRKLLAADVNPDIRELNLEAGHPTALLLACRGGFPECVEVLLEGSADLQIADDLGCTAMHEAAGSTSSDDHTQAAVLSILLRHPSAHSIQHKLNKNGQSALMLASARGFTTCIKLLLMADGPLSKHEMARQGLVSAAQEGSSTAVETLITAGAVSLPTPDGPSALEVCSYCANSLSCCRGVQCVCSCKLVHI